MLKSGILRTLLLYAEGQKVYKIAVLRERKKDR